MPPKNKKDPSGGKSRSGADESRWVRTGGYIGDTSMDEMNEYNESGAGVDESRVRSVKNDPNWEFTDRPARQKGSGE